MAILDGNARRRGNLTRAQTPALLKGLIFASGGHSMTPSHTRKAGRLYRYYVATDAIRHGYAECPVRSVPAAEIEDTVVAQVRHLLQTPEIIARTWAAASPEGEAPVPERVVVARISEFSPLWDELFTRSFVNRLLRLILLAPDIVEAILDGREPKALQLEVLTKSLPSAWDEQRQRLKKIRN